MKNLSIKKRMVIGISLIVLIAVSVFYMQVNKGEFVNSGYSSIGERSLIEKKEPFYFGYSMYWEGIGNPKLKSVHFLRKDGTVYFPFEPYANKDIGKELGDPTVTPWIDEKGNIGLLSYTLIKESGDINHLISLENYKLTEGTFNLVLEVIFPDSNYEDNFHTLVMNYTLFGFNREQQFPFEGFLAIDDEEE